MDKFLEDKRRDELTWIWKQKVLDNLNDHDYFLFLCGQSILLARHAGARHDQVCLLLDCLILQT